MVGPQLVMRTETIEGIAAPLTARMSVLPASRASTCQGPSTVRLAGTTVIR